MRSHGAAEFAELLTEKGATIIIGAGVSYEVGYPLGHELASVLAQDFGVHAEDLESVVNVIIDRGIKREEVMKRIRKIFAEKNKEASKIDPLSNPYFLLSKILKSLVTYWKSRGVHLTVNIITTNFDKELESALEKEFERGPSGYSVMVSKDDYLKPTDAYVKVYKVHGDIYAADSSEKDLMVLTGEDLMSSQEYRKALYSSIKGAVVEGPLLLMGYSFRDKDVQTVYEEAKEALGDIPTFDVHPGGEQKIEGAVTIPETSLEFLKELIDYLSKEFSDLLAYTDYGVELSVDNELEKAIEKAKEKGAPLVLYGRRYSGKSMAVLRAKKKGIFPESYVNVELPKYPVNEEYIESIKDSLQGKALIETSSYQVQFLKGKSSEKKGWLSHLFGKVKEQTKGWLPEDSVLLESKITPEDADKLFDHFSVQIIQRHKEEAGYKREELEEKKDSLLELASWGGSPLKNGMLIPPLLKRVIEDYAGKNKEDLKKIKKLESDRENLLLESFGLSLPEAVAVASEFGDFLNNLKNAVIPFVSKVLLPSAVVLLGVSSIINFYEEKKISGLGKYIQMHRAWNEYPNEKREILCEKLDEKYGLNPGESYSFLSSWLSPKTTEKEYDEFKSKLERVFTDDFIKKLNDVVRKVPELKREIDEIKEEINTITEEIKHLEEELKVETENRLKEGTTELKNPEEIKRSLRISDEAAKGLVVSGEVEQKVDDILSAIENKVCIIRGEAGSGKTTLLYIIARSLFDSGKRVFTVTDLASFNPLEFTKLTNAYAIFDATDDEKADSLKARLKSITRVEELERIVISIRTSYIDKELENIFKNFYVFEHGYRESTLEDIAKKNLQEQLGTKLNEKEIQEYSKKLASNSEGLPLYIVEAVKYIKEKAEEGKFNEELLSQIPRGIEFLLIKILNSEAEKFKGGGILLYYIISHYPGIPEEYARDLEEILGVNVHPHYVSISGSKLFLHSWYRDITDEIAKAYGPENNEYSEIKEALESCTSSLINNNLIKNHYERIYVLMTRPKSRIPRLKEMLVEFNDKFILGQKVNTEDVADLAILSSLIHFVGNNIHKTSGGAFNILKEKIVYSQITPNKVGLYDGLLGFFVNSYLSKESLNNAILNDRLFYYITVFFLSRMIQNKFMDNISGQFIEGSDKANISLAEIFNIYVMISDYVSRIYLSSLSTVLEKLEYFKIKTNYDRYLLYLLQGRYEAAIKEIDKAIELDPNNPDYHNSKGVALAQLERYEEAIKEFDEAITLNPNNPDYHNNKGNALAQLERYEEAIKEYNEAITLNPNNPDYHNSKCVALYDLERYEEAIKEYNEAITLNPNNPDYHNNKGVALAQLERYEEAIKEFDEAITLNPNNPDYHNNKGVALYDLERYEEAIKEYDEAITLNPNNPDYHNSKGDALYDLERYEEAIKEFDEAITLNPNNPDYHNSKGDALYDLERYEEAIKEFDLALKLDLRRNLI